MIGEDAAEVSLAQFSQFSKGKRMTVRRLAVDSQPNTPAAWGWVKAVRPLRRIRLRRFVHAVNAWTNLIFRLTLFSEIGGWKVSTLHDRLTSIFDLFETSKYKNSEVSTGENDGSQTDHLPTK